MVDTGDLKIGAMNDLAICEITDKGCFLDGGAEKLFIPRSQMGPDDAVGTVRNVFIYCDDGRLYATARRPRALMGELAFLPVKGSCKLGYFLDNSLRKDVLLPLNETRVPLRQGEEVLVYLYLDHEKRMCATTRFTRKFSDTVLPGYQAGDVVKVMPVAVTDIGVKAVVDNAFYAMFLNGEVGSTAEIRVGRKLYAVISRIRGDRRVDLVPSDRKDSISREQDGDQTTGTSLPGSVPEHGEHERGSGAGGSDAPSRESVQVAREALENVILGKLREHGGFLPFGDHTPPGTVEKVFHSSKGSFKKALGSLYRRRLITILPDGIRLATTGTSS